MIQVEKVNPIWEGHHLSHMLVPIKDPMSKLGSGQCGTMTRGPWIILGTLYRLEMN